MDDLDSITCPDHYMGFKKMLKVGELELGSKSKVEETPKLCGWLHFPRLLSWVLESSCKDLAG